MEIRHLRYFVAVAEERSFTRASNVVHVAQSTLSHQIRQLEDELGHTLFRRTADGVYNTAAGAIFLSSARKALREFDLAIASIRSVPRNLTGKIEVGVTPSVNFDLVPQAVAAFVGQHPGVQVMIEEHCGNDIVAMVRDARLDLGIAYLPESCSEDLSFEPLFDDELFVLVGAFHPFAKRKRLRMIDLHHQDMVMQPKTCTTRRILDDAFALAGSEPNVVVEMDSLAAIKGLIKKSMIAGLVSRLALKSMPDIVAIPVEGPTPVRVPGLIMLKDRPSFVASSFADTVRLAMEDNRLIVGSRGSLPNV